MSNTPTYEHLIEQNKKLEQQVSEYRNLFHDNLSIMLLIDAETGAITDANRAALHFYGWTHAEITNKKISDINILLETEIFQKINAATRGQQEYFIFQHRLSSGEIKSVEVYSTPVELSGRRVLHSIIHDISHRKELEDKLEAHQTQLKKLIQDRTTALQESETRFTNIFANVSNGCAIYKALDKGEDFELVDFNPAAESIENIKKSEVVGRPVTEVFPGVKDFGLLDALTRVWQTGQPEQHPISLYKDDRIVGWRENYIFRLPSNEIVTVYRDVTEQKQAEEKVLRARDFLQSVIDGVHDSLMVINLDYTIALANQAALKASSSKKIVHGTTCHQLSHASRIPCTGSSHICPLNKVLETKHPQRIEHIHSDEQGQKYIVEIVASPIFNAEGDVVQVIELTRDISKRKHREILKDLQARLSKLSHLHSIHTLQQIFLDEIELLTESPISFFHFCEEGQSTLKLQSWSTNTQNSACTVQKKIKDSPLEKAGIWADCIREKKPLIHNDYASIPHKKGLPPGHIPITRELVVPVLRNNQVVAILGVGNKQEGYNSQDVEVAMELADMAWEIMARKRAEDELRISQEHFSKAFMASPDAMILARKEGGYIVDANESFVKMFLYTREESIGQTSVALGLWEDKEMREKALAPLDEGHSVRDIEMKGRRSTGELFDVSFSCDTMEMRGETYIVAIVKDISAYKKAQQEKKKLEFKLQQSHKMEAMGTLAGGIAHDFNNILAAMLGFTELALVGLPDESKRKKQLLQVQSAGNRAKELVQQILAFSRNSPVEPKPLYVQSIIKEALKLLRPSIPSTITIEQDISQDCEMILADPTNIHQVVVNLCTNAYQAMKRTGGILSIGLHQITVPHSMSIVGPAPGSYIELKIGDTGVGISKDIQDKIFEPYFTTKAKGEGTGLGLAVVHGIITGAGGTVSVQSEPGAGTSFRVVLPTIAHTEEFAQPEDDRPLPVGTEHVLLVDDDPALTQMGTMMLEPLGYTVSAFTDSTKALAAFRKQPSLFDIVITDMTMPLMTGEKLARAMLHIRPDIPVILITGYGEEVSRKASKNSGIRGYLTKPVQIQSLADLTRKLLDQTYVITQ